MKFSPLIIISRLDTTYDRYLQFTVSNDILPRYSKYLNATLALPWWAVGKFGLKINYT